MRVQVNGEPREVGEGATLADLLAALQVGVSRVAVEVNLQIVPRSQYAEHRLAEGDTIEIVSFVGGG